MTNGFFTWMVHLKTTVRADIVLHTLDGSILEQALTLDFPATNNEAEYEALLAGLRMARELGIQRLQVYCDSLLITNQISGEYTAHNPNMAAYMANTHELTK